MNRSTRFRALCSLSLLLLAAGACHAAPDAATALRDDYRRFLFEGRRLVPLNPTSLNERTVGKLVVERVRITTEAGEDAVVLITRPPRAKRYPTVLLQHFLGGRKDDETMSFLSSLLASNGYLVAAIDGRYRGERDKGKTLPQAIEEALVSGHGHPWLIDTVFDDLRTLDYLVTREDVDPARIGMAGISEGGIETWMAAAADPRIRAAVSVIGVTRFQNIIASASNGLAAEAYVKAFQQPILAYARKLGETSVTPRVIRQAWEQLLPGFMDRFDPIRLVPLIAPRPLLILSHENDEIIPLAGAKEVYEAAEKRYTELGAADRLQMQVSPRLKHAALDLKEPLSLMAWFNAYLKPADQPSTSASASRAADMRSRSYAG